MLSEEWCGHHRFLQVQACVFSEGKQKKVLHAVTKKKIDQHFLVCTSVKTVLKICRLGVSQYLIAATWFRQFCCWCVTVLLSPKKPVDTYSDDLKVRLLLSHSFSIDLLSLTVQYQSCHPGEVCKVQISRCITFLNCNPNPPDNEP